MFISTFSHINRARCEAKDGFNTPLNNWSRNDWLTAALGELGEAANVAKKMRRIETGVSGNDDKTYVEFREQFLQELADALTYIDLTIQAEGGDTESVLLDKFAIVSARIGYSPPTISKLAEVQNYPEDKKEGNN